MAKFKQLYGFTRRVKATLYVIRMYSDAPPSKIRNIGIIAHIDAGKTTTTESMLFHAGKIRRMGKVDSGSTVTDFLPSERARGITVQSAAVSFDWKKHFINLIDTPGHVDFTIEVERALHVLDGVVAILDGSRGVEAQTRKVWRQADQLKIPRIAFINKMDKTMADFAASVRSLQEVLSANTFVTQFPIINDGFHGIIDIVNLTVIKWKDINHPESFQTTNLKGSDADVLDQCLAMRRKLIEQLSDIDDGVAEKYLARYSEDVLNFPANILSRSLASAVKNHGAVPVLCGSAVKDIGVTSLLDAILEYLPSPADSNKHLSTKHKGNLRGYTFKVVHHKRFGAVVFARILSGKIAANRTIYNASKDHKEHVGQLFTVFADEYKSTETISDGHIAAITGLKYTGTGDTIYAQKGDKDEILAPVTIPQPVFFCTIEADSPTEQKALEICLAIITREDPSIRIKMDSNSGQTILCGMGELHMEVLIERIKKEFKLNCYIGPLQVAYRETIQTATKRDLKYTRKIFDKSHNIKMTISIKPSSHSGDVSIRMQRLSLSPEVARAIKDGLIQACHSGPIMGFPLMRAEVMVHSFEMTSNSPSTVITASAVNMMNELLQDTNCGILEPMMNIEVVTTMEKLPLVLKSLAQKHANISEIKGNEMEKSVLARAPVAEMLGFASRVRKISSGNADLTLEVAGYEEISNENIEHLRNRLIGKEY